MPLTLEDKFEAIEKLGPAFLKLERRFHWAISQRDVYRVHREGEGEPLQGTGTNPYEAMHNYFDAITRDRVVLYTVHPEPRLVRWNIDHWTSVRARDHFAPEEQHADDPMDRGGSGM